jgi:hypothetical protein
LTLCRGQRDRAQPGQSGSAKEIIELSGRRAQDDLAIDEHMDPVFHHRPDADQEEAVAQDLLAHPLFPQPDIRRRQQVTAEEVGENPRVDAIGFDPGLGEGADFSADEPGAQLQARSPAGRT